MAGLQHEGSWWPLKRELVQYAEKYGRHSRLAVRLMVERLVWDQSLKIVDPNAETNFERGNKQREKQFGLSTIVRTRFEIWAVVP